MGKSMRIDRAGRVGVVAVVVAAFILLAVLALLPQLLWHKTHGQGGPWCQSNMSQIGRALKMYLSEWNDCYPTNRNHLPNGKLGRVSAHVKLTPYGCVDKTNQPERFRYGVSWVEALYPYLEMANKDAASAWKCPALDESGRSAESSTSAVSYAFNRNLIERPEIVVRNGADTLAVREMDRLVDSDLRPTNYSCGRPDEPPDSPFLTKNDSRLGETEPNLHNNASNVLFADSHVKRFTTDHLPDRITAPKCWDAKDRRWYNFVDPRDPKKCKSIAITP